MKYLALLKDSLLEAIDTKIFYVMIGLSGLVILIVACIGFTPQPVADLSERFTVRTLNVTAEEWKKTPFHAPDEYLPRVHGIYSQVKVEPLNGAPDRPDSPLRFVVRAQYRSGEEADKVRRAPAAAFDFIKKRFATVGNWKILEVTNVRLIASGAQVPGSVEFEIQTQPTKATLRVWPHEPNLFFGLMPLHIFKGGPLGFQILRIEDQLVNRFGAWIAILVGVILSAFFVPNMLRKGTVELLLVKPIHRTTLLLYKYVGGLSFIFLNTAVAIIGIWLALGIRSGIWANGFLLTIFILTFFFAILYSVSTLFGVLTGNPLVAVIMTCLAWVIFFGAGLAYIAPDFLRAAEEINQVPAEQRISNGSWVSVVKGIHYVLPRVKDLDYLNSRLLFRDLLTTDELEDVEMKDATFSWTESLTVDGIFIGAMLGAACLRFATKDY